MADRRFSLLMAVYRGERPAFLVESLESVRTVLAPPDEIVMVEDGPLNDGLHDVISSFSETLPIKIVRLPVNGGLPAALNVGLAHCKHEFVARFDTDDICYPNRFSVQVEFLLRHPSVAALSSWVEEFDVETGKRLSLRAPPSSHAEIKQFAKLRNPLNHPAAMFRRSAVLRVGGYEADKGFEDYSLWLRLLDAGFELANVPSVLVRMRAGRPQAQRRGGLGYARSEVAFATKFWKRGTFTLFDYLKFVSFRVPFRLLSAPLLSAVYRRFARV